MRSRPRPPGGARYWLSRLDLHEALKRVTGVEVHPMRPQPEPPPDEMVRGFVAACEQVDPTWGDV